MFGRWENVRKGKKMKEKGNSGKTPASVFSSSITKKILITRFVLSIYIAPNRKKNTKIPSKHNYTWREKMGKRESNRTKSKKCRRNFRTGVQNCVYALLLLLFYSSFPSDFRYAKLGSTHILHAWAHSTNLALIRSVEKLGP